MRGSICRSSRRRFRIGARFFRVRRRHGQWRGACSWLRAGQCILLLLLMVVRIGRLMLHARMHAQRCEIDQTASVERGGLLDDEVKRGAHDARAVQGEFVRVCV